MRNALSYSQILAIRTEHVLHIMLGRVVTLRWSSLMGMVMYFMAGMGSCVAGIGGTSRATCAAASAEGTFTATF